MSPGDRKKGDKDEENIDNASSKAADEEVANGRKILHSAEHRPVVV